MAQKEIQSAPLNRKAWKRLKRNKSAVFGMSVIVLAIILALFAYAVSPDNSPMGNDQILQLETHPPGFSIQIFKKPKDNFQPTGLLRGLVGGFDRGYESVPINSYTLGEDSLEYTEYRGNSFRPEKHHIAYADLFKGSNKNLRGDEARAYCSRHLFTERTFWLGTDKFGRDILSRLIIGVRVSLSVGLVSVFIALFIGIILGALAGYFPGWIDDGIMWLINVFWSIPTLLLAMGLYVSAENFFDDKLTLIFVAVGITMWVETARIVRGQVLSIRELEYVSAAKSLGYADSRIIFHHILPNILGPVIVIACANFANAILVESGLSYIGLGIQPPAPSWGSMLNEYKDFIDTNKAYLALFPGFAIMLLVLAFNLVGNGLRDALDVKGQLD